MHPRLDRLAALPMSRVQAPENPQICGFFDAHRRMDFPRAVLIGRCRSRDVPQPEWAIGWAKERVGPSTSTKVPAFNTQGEQG